MPGGLRGSGTRLRDAVVVVTGAGSGLGRAICRYAADRGAVVVASDVDEASAQETLDLAHSAGARGRAVRTDVANAREVRSMIHAARDTYGRIDYLFNNAGIALNGEFQDTGEADWKTIVDVNLWGVIHGCRAAYPIMMAQGSGHIVNVSSIAGLVPGGLMTAYATTKYAVVGFSTNLRSEARQYGIRVTALCPGYLETPMHASAQNVSDYVESHDARYRSRPHLWPTAEDTVNHMMRGVLRNRAVVVSPRLQAPLWWVHRLIPGALPWFWTWMIGRIKRREGERPPAS